MKEQQQKRRKRCAGPGIHTSSSRSASMEEEAAAKVLKLDSFVFTSGIARVGPCARDLKEKEEDEEEAEERHAREEGSSNLNSPSIVKTELAETQNRSPPLLEKHTMLHTEANDLKHGGTIPGASNALADVARQLVADLADTSFRLPVTCVYNPLVYAWNLHEQYIQKHGGRRVQVLLVGMNPGPFGMAQTGVPFGDSSFVRSFHILSGKVDSPVVPHPNRPIHGLECKRCEVSGQRLWGWAQDRFGSAAAFFDRFWVYNYCPLVFMEASGKNRTPDKLHPSERQKLESACNKALVKTVTILRPAFVVGVGKYAARKIQGCNIRGVKVGEIMHPSPANPKANKDWAKKVEAQLAELGVKL